MFKPFFNRKYNCDAIEESNDWLFWRWYDITSQEAQGSGDSRIQMGAPVYLRRLYLLRTPWFSIMLHRIKLPDPDRHLHDHPWNFLAIVLRGFYIEQRNDPDSWIPTYNRRSWFNFCRASGAHKIVRVSPTCTTLVITGRKQRSWGFHTDQGWMHWKEYIYGR